jgi:RecA-family ATPase
MDFSQSSSSKKHMKSKGLRGHTGKTLLNFNVQKIPMLIKDLLPTVGLAALAGSSDTGKSAILRQLAISICERESNFIGIPLYTKHNAVTYISTEDDYMAFAALLNKQKSIITDVENMERMYVYTYYRIDSLVKELDSHLTKRPCDLVIVDAVSDIILGDMNSQNTVRSKLSDFSALAKKHKCLFLFLHHLNKNTKGAVSKNHLNGSQAFEAKMRAVLILSKTDDSNPHSRSLHIAKGNYTPQAMKDNATQLLFDENTLTFTKTASIQTSLIKTKNNEEELREAVMKHHLNGKPIREIEDLIKNEPFKAGKTKISEIIKEQTKEN